MGIRRKSIGDYKTLIFDCDGVILNSNFIKGKCFYEAAITYGQRSAQELIDYHRSIGGVSRVKKFEYFIENILPKNEIYVDNPKHHLNNLLEVYRITLKKLMYKCKVSPYLKPLREICLDQKWIIISGADQDELLSNMETKSVSNYFNGGIYGGPRDKLEIMQSELIEEGVELDALFIGDSKYDYECAKYFKIDFIFLYDWTDLPDWEKYCLHNSIAYCKNLSELI